MAKKQQDDGDATGGIVPYKNPLALAGYYFGVFSLLPIAFYAVAMLRRDTDYAKPLLIVWVLGILLAPAAIVFGLFGLRWAGMYPTAKGKGHALTALVLGGLALLGHVACVLVLLAVTMNERK